MALLTIKRKEAQPQPTLQNVVGKVTDNATGTVEWVKEQTPELTKEEIARLIKVHIKSAPNFQRAKEVKAAYQKGDSVSDVVKKLGNRHGSTMVAIDLKVFREAKPPINLKNKFVRGFSSDSYVRNKKTQ